MITSRHREKTKEQNIGLQIRYMLADLMLSNLYIIPQLLDQPIEKYDIWQFSSDGDMDYFDYIPDEVLNEFTIEDMNWIKKCHDSFMFQRIRQRYIKIYGQLQNVKDAAARKKLLAESHTLLDQLSPDLKPGISG